MKTIFYVLMIFLVACSQTGSNRVIKRPTQDFTVVTDPVIPYCTGAETDLENCIEHWCEGTDEDPEDCIQRPAELVRTSDSISINNDYCICENGTSLINNNCNNFCLEKGSSDTSILYGNVTLREDAIGANFKNLQEWCTQERNGESSPYCFLELCDSSGCSTLTLNVTGNNFTVDVRNISNNHPYIMRIVENNSNAKSMAVHLLKTNSSMERYKGPLKMIGVSMYSCVTRSGWTVNTERNTDHLDNFMRMHFYFANNTIPEHIPPSTNVRLFLYCHDPNLNNQGPNDQSYYDRLETVQDQFFLWDKTDVMTYDLDGDGYIDANTYIRDYLLNKYNQTLASSEVFRPLRWFKLPVQVGEDAESANASPILGFVMQPWVDQSSDLKQGFCPNEYHYKGSNPLFRELGNMIGTPTEALYIAESEPTLISNADGSVESQAYRDKIFIRESMLRKIWFYREYDGDKYLYFIPDDVTASQKQIQFYWPPFYHNDSVFFRRSGQLLYSIKNINELSDSDTEESDVRRDYSIPDKRFACVPKGGNEPTLK